jgi:NAD(P)-dependent dehydrogenase (short-subunit alcohol dehydrogenase family)
MRGAGMGRLAGKRALVTGGTTGIGRAIAESFTREGARVVITGRDVELGAAAAADLGVMFMRADASVPEEVSRNVGEAVEALGGLDVLVNNAGVGVVAGALETSLKLFDFVMNTNLRGAFCYAKECFPHLERSRGCMIHIASDAGVLGEAEIAIYSVSKAALMMLSNMLAIEGGRRGVRSNAICPGDTEPGMRHMIEPDGVADDPGDPGDWPLPPIGRIGRGVDVALAAVYLASDEAAFINGVQLLVDGGMRAGMRTGSQPERGSAPCA